MSRRRPLNVVTVVFLAICLFAAGSGLVSTVASVVADPASAQVTSMSSGPSIGVSSRPVVATAVTSGDTHSCALIDTGAIKCWGTGSAATLGAGPTISSSSEPVDVLDISDATAIAGGGASTCAIVTGGAVKCWGSNSSGQLGDGTTTDRSIPVAVIGLTEPVAQVVVGASHACALTDLGGVKCWGRNDDQRLGDPSFPLGSIATTPVTVLGLESGVTAISAGVNHTCAVVSGGAKCWGRNDYGALGASSSGELVQVQTLTSGVVAVGAGIVHSCAVMDTGIVNCWGAGWGGGGLGRGDAGPDGDPVPGPVVNLTNAASIDVTGGRSCVVTTADEVKCWGFNNSGNFANGSDISRWYNAPQSASGYADAIMVTGGDGHTCALTRRGRVRCSGTNVYGALGAGAVADQASGIDVIGIDGTPPPSPLKMMFDPVTTSCGTSTAGVALSGSVSATIDWGDSTSDVVTSDGTTEHTYSDSIAHEIAISGSAGYFSAATARPGASCVTGVSQWGTLGLTSLSSAFNGLANLTSVPTDLPWTVTDVSSMFESAASFNQNISTWDTSNVTNMQSMFAWTQSFDQPLASWDLSSVTNLAYMFNNAAAFNEPIDAWNTASVTSFRGMFWGASSFDQSLPNWSFASAHVAALWQFLGAGGLSREKFSISLIGWATRSQNSGVLAYLGVEHLASASDAVANLRSKGWDIRGTSLYVPPTTTTTVPPTTTTTEAPTTTTTVPPTTTTTPPPPPIYSVTFSCGRGGGSTPADRTGRMSQSILLPNSASPCEPPALQEFAGWQCLSIAVDPGGAYVIAGDSMCTARWIDLPVPTTTTTVEMVIPVPSTTAPPITAPPITAPPITAPPITVPPTTEPSSPAPTTPPAPVIDPPTSVPPTTAPPTTAPPTTAPPAVVADPSVDNAEQLAAVNQVLASPSASTAEVKSAVSNLLDAGVTGAQATELATSPKVLASIDSSQATKVFKEIPVGKLDAAQEAALVAAVTSAPDNVKNAFEGTIDVYGAGFDDYVPVGSVVDVGERRTLVAAAAATAVAGSAAAGAVSAGGSSSGGGSGGGKIPTGADALNEAQLAGVARRMGRSMLKKKSDGPDGSGPKEGELMTKTRPSTSKILKRLVRETAAIGFTIAGGVVVIFTLSGATRKVAMIALGTAFILHVLHVVLTTRPD